MEKSRERESNLKLDEFIIQTNGIWPWPERKEGYSAVKDGSSYTVVFTDNIIGPMKGKFSPSYKEYAEALKTFSTEYVKSSLSDVWDLYRRMSLGESFSITHDGALHKLDYKDMGIYAFINPLSNKDLHSLLQGGHIKSPVLTKWYIGYTGYVKAWNDDAESFYIGKICISDNIQVLVDGVPRTFKNIARLYRHDSLNYIIDLDEGHKDYFS
jgi:hypothetical protein